MHRTQRWDYLSFRLWVGAWIGLILLIMVATDASVLVKYITRFTEEGFATLISAIFIYKAFTSVWHINDHQGVLTQTDERGGLLYRCACNISASPKLSNATRAAAASQSRLIALSAEFTRYDCQSFGDDPANAEVIGGENVTMVGTLVSPTGDGHGGCNYEPDVFFFAVLLFFGTYMLSTSLKGFKMTPYFPAGVS